MVLVYEEETPSEEYNKTMRIGASSETPTDNPPTKKRFGNMDIITKEFLDAKTRTVTNGMIPIHQEIVDQYLAGVYAGSGVSAAIAAEAAPDRIDLTNDHFGPYQEKDKDEHQLTEIKVGVCIVW